MARRFRGGDEWPAQLNHTTVKLIVSTEVNRLAFAELTRLSYIDYTFLRIYEKFNRILHYLSK